MERRRLSNACTRSVIADVHLLLHGRIRFRSVFRDDARKRTAREAVVDNEPPKGKGINMMSLVGVIIIAALVAAVVTVILVLVVYATSRADSTSQNNPNLAPCPDCGRQVSIRATTCPHCGGPIQFK